MSSTSNVCQLLPSSLETSLVQPLVSMFQLSPSKPEISIPWTQMPSLCSEEKSNKNGKLGGWNSLQSLSNSKNSSENVYVHPLDKRSSCAMSNKSLEMCTESLGCETGTKINGGMEEFTSLLSMKRQTSSGIHRPKPPEISKKMSKINSFPPPLTSIGGSNGVQVSSHREGGRLVIKAVNSSSCNVHFQTERENGRLRLSLPKEDYRHFIKRIEDENEEENVPDEKEDDDEEVNAYETENESRDHNSGGGEDEADFNGGFWGKMEGKLGVKLEVQSGVAAAAGARKITRGCQVCIFVWRFPKSFLLELTAFGFQKIMFYVCFINQQPNW